MTVGNSNQRTTSVNTDCVNEIATARAGNTAFREDTGRLRFKSKVRS